MFAAALVGADVVPLNTDFRADALTAVVSAHQITTIICEQEFAERAQAAGEAITVIDPATVTTREHDPRPPVAAPGRVIILTAGTTGTPKGVPRTSHIGSTLSLATTILDLTGLRSGSRSSVAVPMFRRARGPVVLSQLRIVLVLRGTEDDADGVIEFGDDPGCEWDASRDAPATACSKETPDALCF